MNNTSGLVVPKEEDNPVLDDIVQQMQEGTAAKHELSVLKPLFAYALSKLDRKQLRVREQDMENIGTSYELQAKSDGQGGIILRSVRVL